MLCYNTIDLSEGILLKVVLVKFVWFVTIGFLKMDSDFKILYVMVVMIWLFCGLTLVTLLLSMLKTLIIVVLFMTLASLKQFVYQKFIMCLMIVGIYKRHQFEESNLQLV